MFIAHQLKHKNIAEYLLYMWQVEDIVRALDADIDKIERVFITPMHLTPEQHQQEVDWYDSIIDMMRREETLIQGHIQLIQNTMLDLEETHQSLLDDTDHPAYRAAYYSLVPSLVVLRSKSLHPGQTDLEMCFVFLYGIMNLRRQGKEISAETTAMQKQVSGLIAQLSQYYHDQQTAL